jgi:hypothetical protein
VRRSIRVSSRGTGCWRSSTTPFEGPRDDFATSAASSVTQAVIYYNFNTMFTDQGGLARAVKLQHRSFYPYLVGGILPGIIAATILCLRPAYQTAAARRCARN